MTKAILHPSGVYAIKNTINEKRYVGSSVDIPSRFTTHKSALRRNKHHSAILQNSWNLHGADAFMLEILEVIDEVECIKAAEQKWMNHYRSFDKDCGYNVSRTAENGNRGVKQTPEFVEKRMAPLRGKKRTPEQRARISESLAGKKKVPQSAEDRAKKSEAGKRRIRTPEELARGAAALLAYSQSPEGRAANSERQKGYKPTEEARENMREAQKRRWENASEEDRQKLLNNLAGGAQASAAKRTGTKMSESARLKLSKIKTGTKHSDETKQKISEANRRRHALRRAA